MDISEARNRWGEESWRQQDGWMETVSTGLGSWAASFTSRQPGKCIFIHSLSILYYLNSPNLGLPFTSEHMLFISRP